MSLGYFSATILLLTVLVYRWGVTGMLQSPARLLFMGNAVYFFALFFLLTDVQSRPAEYASTIAVVFLCAFVATDFLAKVSLGRGPAIALQRKRHSVVGASPQIHYLYLAVVGVALYQEYIEVGSLDFATVFSASYLRVEGVMREAGSYAGPLIWRSFLWFVFLISLHAAVREKRGLLTVVLLLAQTSYGAFQGNKAALLLPSIYWLFLFWNSHSARSGEVRASARQRPVVSGLVLLAAALGIGYLLVYLNGVRSGYVSDDDFIDLFRNRIDYIPTLAGYLSHHAYFEHIWPGREFIVNFIPSGFANALGIEKTRISFDVAYTQFAYGDYRISSSAGVGVAAFTELLKPFGMDIPTLAAVLAGAAAAVLTEWATKHIRNDLQAGGAFWFALLVPPMHIIGFFEPGPTLLFRLVLTALVVVIVVVPLLSALSFTRPVNVYRH